MSVFLSELIPNKIRLLVVKDLDIGSVSRLAEHFVHQPPQFTACVACGPLTAVADETPEGVALALGAMASTIAQLENIVCRVIYLPSASDPTEALFKELHLTPNSVNIHARWLTLVPGLAIGGYTEKSQLERKDSDDGDESDEEEESKGKAYIEASNSSDVVKELLMNAPLPPDASPQCPHHSILLLNTSYAHTLNQVLFHSQSEMGHASVSTCICPSMENRDSSATGAKKKIKELDLIGPMSLKDGNNYLVLEYTCSDVDGFPDNKQWHLSASEFCSL